MRSRVFFLLAILLALAGLGSAQTPAANDTDNVTITVTINSVTWIDVNPATLSWTGVNPGTQTGKATGNYFAINIENIGSRNISRIWANATYETTRPWGTGDPSRYNAGNFVSLTNQSDPHYWFVNRVEYNESEVLVYLTDPNQLVPPQGYSYGRFRNASLEYFWMTANDGNCNATAHTILIGNDAHTRTQSGTINFFSGSFQTVSLTAATNVPGWAAANIAAGPLAGYCVAMEYTCGRVWLYKWNMDAPGAGIAGQCTNAMYLRRGTEAVGSLAPGAYFPANITLTVPYGVAQGTISGVLTILASDVS